MKDDFSALMEELEANDAAGDAPVDFVRYVDDSNYALAA